MFLVPKQTGAGFIEATNKETKPNKHTVDGEYFCSTKTVPYKVKQKMFSLPVATLSKLGLLYLLNFHTKDYTQGISRTLSQSNSKGITDSIAPRITHQTETLMQMQPGSFEACQVNNFYCAQVTSVVHQC